jgi:hypothetical protein
MDSKVFFDANILLDFTLQRTGYGYHINFVPVTPFPAYSELNIFLYRHTSAL